LGIELWHHQCDEALAQSGNFITPVGSWFASSSPTLTGETNYLNLANQVVNLFFRPAKP
jgi:hypothetical protein